jgi:uncharacterized membrane protein YphA (DoxX/SURF4 family)
MTRARLVRFASWTARVVLAGVFAAAALPKIADPATFATDIVNYRLLPEAATALPAIVLPWIELTAALAVLWPRSARGAAVLIGALLLAFIAALLSAIARGLDIECGCFGGAPANAPPPSLWPTVVRDVALLVAVWVVLAWPGTDPSIRDEA